MKKRTRFVPILLWLFSFFMVSAQNNAQKDSTRLLTPNYLKKGDTIAIVAPAGILRNKKPYIDKAITVAKSWGLHVVVGKNMYNQNHHFSGTDAERTADFQAALDNPNIKAIWCARGGYGSVRILDKLDFTKFAKHPKWIIGYSDVTAFHNHLNNLGYETIHAMMGSSFWFEEEEIQQSIQSLKKALFGKELSYQVSGSKYNKEGEASGKLVGGNLTLLLTMLGSKSQLNTAGNILFIEEIGEYKYHIDRVLQSLKRAGYFDKLKGVIVGDMSKIRRNTTKWGSSIEELILDVFAEYDFPVLFNFPAGHEPDNRALLFGREVTISVSKTQSTLQFK